MDGVRCWVLVALVILAGCGGSAGSDRVRATPTPTPVATAEEPVRSSARTAVVWGVERPARAARRLRRHPAVEAVTIARRGVALLRSRRSARGRAVQRVRAGYAIPLDVLAVDPRRFAAASAEPALASLGAGEVALSETSARLRGVGSGATLRLVGGRRLRVAAVVMRRRTRSS
jgi:hypothetical protein